MELANFLGSVASKLVRPRDGAEAKIWTLEVGIEDSKNYSNYYQCIYVPVFLQLYITRPGGYLHIF